MIERGVRQGPKGWCDRRYNACVPPWLSHMHVHVCSPVRKKRCRAVQATVCLPPHPPLLCSVQQLRCQPWHPWPRRRSSDVRSRFYSRRQLQLRETCRSSPRHWPLRLIFVHSLSASKERATIYPMPPFTAAVRLQLVLERVHRNNQGLARTLTPNEQAARQPSSPASSAARCPLRGN